MGSSFAVFLAVCCVLSFMNASEVTISMKPNTVPVYFIEGRPLTLTCTVHGKTDKKIEWTKDERPLDSDYQIESFTDGDEQNPTQNVRLTKSAAGHSDNAYFRCSAGSVDLVVQTSSFTVFIREANITEGADTTLTCKPELDYINKTVTWYKGDTPLEEVPELKGRVDINNDTVTFRKTRLTDSGVYNCRVEIGPTKEYSQVFQENVSLQGKPYIVNQDSPALNQEVKNSSVVFKCPAGGYPAPDVFWFRGSEVLESYERIRVTALNGIASGQLEIINLTEVDYGQYSCTAENALGKATLTFEYNDQMPSSGLKCGLDFLGLSSLIMFMTALVVTVGWTR